MSSLLIVDDEHGLAQALCVVLAAEGYTVATAVNGKLGLEALARSRPDVILLDVMMPLMSGPVMMRTLLADPAFREIPVIMMSAVGPESVPVDLRDRIRGFLQKPFHFDELLDALASCLDDPPAGPPAVPAQPGPGSASPRRTS